MEKKPGQNHCQFYQELVGLKAPRAGHVAHRQRESGVNELVQQNAIRVSLGSCCRDDSLAIAISANHRSSFQPKFRS